MPGGGTAAPMLAYIWDSLSFFIMISVDKAKVIFDTNILLVDWFSVDNIEPKEEP